MKWRNKARIQKAVSVLPPTLSRAVYFRLQRWFGRLGSLDVFRGLKAGATTARLARRSGVSTEGARFLEVGTGWVPMMPVSFWLLGASGTVTIDLAPWMNAALTRRCLQDLARRADEVYELFGARLQADRFEQLLAFQSGASFSLEALLEMCAIDYRAGMDAADTALPSAAFDVHCSYTVLEHVPVGSLPRVLQEGARLLRPRGVFVHRIDYTDHFSHTDSSIDEIHFLRYSDKAWRRIAGNRFMFMNRLRHDDCLELLAREGHEILDVEVYSSESLRRRIENNELPLHGDFAGKDSQVLATLGAWIVSRPGITG